MQIEKAFIFGRQITAGEAPFEVIWHNSRNASPMQVFSDGGSPVIVRGTEYRINFAGRDNQWYSEPEVGFLGIQATKVKESQLPYSFEVPFLLNGEDTGFRLSFHAEMQTSEYGKVLYTHCDSHSYNNHGYVSQEADDQSCEFYLFAGAGAFLGSRDGSALVYDTAYFGCIAQRVNSEGKRMVDINGGAQDLLYYKNVFGWELPTEWLT